MPGYVLQVNRVAKPGHSKEVLDAVTAQSEKVQGLGMFQFPRLPPQDQAI